MVGGCRFLLVSSIHDSVLIIYLVLQIPCFCIFMWPLSVAGAELGIYFWTAHAVKLGHAENCLLFIDFIIVCLGGINSAWYGYLMGAALYVTVYALYDMCLVLPEYVFVDIALHSCSGNIHNIVCGSRPPFHTSLLL